MYWTFDIDAEDLHAHVVSESGASYAMHIGVFALRITEQDVETFVRPKDASFMLVLRAADDETDVQNATPALLGTLRRLGDEDAVIETFNRVFAHAADGPSAESLLRGLVDFASARGYARVLMTSALFQDALFPRALDIVADDLGRPIEFQPSSGWTMLTL